MIPEFMHVHRHRHITSNNNVSILYLLPYCVFNTVITRWMITIDFKVKQQQRYVKLKYVLINLLPITWSHMHRGRVWFNVTLFCFGEEASGRGFFCSKKLLWRKRGRRRNNSAVKVQKRKNSQSRACLFWSSLTLRCLVGPSTVCYNHRKWVNRTSL